MGGYKWGAYLPGGLVLQPHYPVQGGCCTIQCSRTIQCMVTQEGPLTSGGCTCPAQPHYPVQMGVALSSADRGKLDYPVHSCTTQLSWHFPVRKKLKHAKSTDCDSIQHRNTIHCRAAFQKVLLWILTKGHGMNLAIDLLCILPTLTNEPWWYQDTALLMSPFSPTWNYQLPKNKLSLPECFFNYTPEKLLCRPWRMVGPREMICSLFLVNRGYFQSDFMI